MPVRPSVSLARFSSCASRAERLEMNCASEVLLAILNLNQCFGTTPVGQRYDHTASASDVPWLRSDKRLLVSLVCLINPPQTFTSSSRSFLILDNSMTPVWHSRAKNLDNGESRMVGLDKVAGNDLSHSSAWVLRVDIQAGRAVSVEIEGPRSPSSSSVVLILRSLLITASPDLSAQLCTLERLDSPSAVATRLSAV